MGLGNIGWCGLATNVPCSLVPLALGLYIVAVWHGSLVDDGPRDIFTIYQGPESTSWPGVSSGRAQTP